MLLQTDGANPTPHERPGRRWEVEGREPEVEEDLRTGWVTVQGKRECQVETETEEMKTPEARQIVDPVPSPPPRVEVDSERWWELNGARLRTEEGYREMMLELGVAELERREAGQKS